MIANAYAAVMNPEVNPLRQLPKMVRFQIMTSLALMWSTFSPVDWHDYVGRPVDVRPCHTFNRCVLHR